MEGFFLTNFLFRTQTHIYNLPLNCESYIESSLYLIWNSKRFFLFFALQTPVRIAFWKYRAYHEAGMVFGWIQLEWFGDKLSCQKTKLLTMHRCAKHQPSIVMLTKMGKFFTIRFEFFRLFLNFKSQQLCLHFVTCTQFRFCFLSFRFNPQIHQWLFQFSGRLRWSFDI